MKVTKSVFFASDFSEELQVFFHSSAIGKSIVLQSPIFAGNMLIILRSIVLSGHRTI
jgi:hypothetical protein